MKKLLPIIFILLVAGQAWGATYFVSQSGAGDGSAVGTPDSVADYNAGVFGALDNDTVYFIGTITTVPINPDSGADANNVVTLRGDYPGYEATIASENAPSVGINIITNSFVSLIGFTFSGAHTNGNIYMDNANNIIIDSCSFTNSASGGNNIRMHASSADVHDISVSNCSFLGNVGDNAHAIGGNATNNYRHYDFSISDTTADSVYTFFNLDDNAYVDEQYFSENIQIDRVVVTNTRWDAIRTGGGIRGSAETSWIKDSTFTNIGDGVTTALNAIQLSGCLTGAMLVEGNTITNVVTGGASDGCGIIIDYINSNSDFPSNGVIIRDNTVSGCTTVLGAGIHNFVGNGSVIERNIVHSNLVGIRVGGAAANGVTASSGYYNNTIVENTRGIHIGATEAGDGVWTNNLFSANTTSVDNDASSTHTFLTNSVFGGACEGIDCSGWIQVNPRLTSAYVPMNKTVANGGTLGSWLDSTCGLTRYGSGPPIGAKERPEMRFIPRIGPPFRPVIGWNYYTAATIDLCALCLTFDGVEALTFDGTNGLTF